MKQRLYYFTVRIGSNNHNDDVEITVAYVTEQCLFDIVRLVTATTFCLTVGVLYVMVTGGLSDCEWEIIALYLAATVIFVTISRTALYYNSSSFIVT